MKNNNNEQRKMWQWPWRFPESIAVTCGIIAAGIALQLAVGNFNFYFLASPVNLIVGGVIIAICVLLPLGENNKFLNWFSGIEFSVSLMLATLALCIIMGLTPQSTGDAPAEAGNIFARLGFTQMTRSWPLVLTYTILMLSLGCLIVRRLRRFRARDYAFYANHIGLWLILFAAGLGYADMERYILHVREGEVEWRVYDDEGNIKNLPIAIQLNDFDMDVYPPKLAVINRNEGVPLPEDNPDYYQIDIKEINGHLYGWDITMEEYIHQAVRNSDSTYKEVPMPGASPAVRITAVNNLTGEKREGWVCGGNQAQLYMTLNLDDDYCVVMTQAEPRRFMSDVEVYTQKGDIKKGLLEVNSPIKTGSWTIYQYGYDNQAGRLSTYSSMELVYDPWKIPVYIGFALVALGSLAMIWNGKKTRTKQKAEQ